MFATSKMAAITLQNRLKSGRPVPIKSIFFPIWGEGLMNSQKSDWILLLVRIIIIGIPVYLETRLKSRDRSTYTGTILPHTYEASPTTNWVKYENKSGDGISVLRSTGAYIARRCISYDRDGWSVAKIANVTYLKNKNIDTISCVSGTERRLFKYIRELPHHAQMQNSFGRPPMIIQNITLQFSISYGTFHSFPPSAETVKLSTSGGDTVYRIKNRTVLKKTEYDSALQCYDRNQLTSEIYNWSIVLHIVCQNITGRVVDFQKPPIILYDLFNDSMMNNLENGTIHHATALVNITSMDFVGRAEFPGRPMLTAEHIANIGPGFHYRRLSFSPERFQRTINELLYTKHENRKAILRLEITEQVTDLDSVFLTVLVAEIIFVVVVAAVVQFIAGLILKLEDIPTDLNGLSKCWARQFSSSHPEGRKYINLIINEKCDEAIQFSPVNANGGNDNQDNIFSYIGTGKAILSSWQSLQRWFRNIRTTGAES